MSKDDIAVSSSTIALLLNLTSMQIITISMALVSVFFCYESLNSALIIFFVIGIMLNLSALILLLVSIFSEKLSKGIIHYVIKLLKFFKVRNIESKKSSFYKVGFFNKISQIFFVEFGLAKISVFFLIFSSSS